MRNRPPGALIALWRVAGQLRKSQVLGELEQQIPDDRAAREVEAQCNSFGVHGYLRSAAPTIGFCFATMPAREKVRVDVGSLQTRGTEA